MYKKLFDKSTLSSVLIAVTMIVMSACGRNSTRDAMLQYVPDDFTMVMMADLQPCFSPDVKGDGVNADAPEQAPITVLLNQLWPILDQWSVTMDNLRGFDPAHTLVFTLPDVQRRGRIDQQVLVMPVSDANLLERSLLDCGFTARKVGDTKVYVPTREQDRSAVISDGLIWMVRIAEPDTLVARINRIKQRAANQPLQGWKRDRLADEDASVMLLSIPTTNMGADYACAQFTLGGDCLSTDVSLCTSAGEERPFIDPESVGRINADVLEMLPDDCFLVEANVWPDNVDTRRVIASILPVPERATPIYYILRRSLAEVIDNAQGTSAMSVSFRGHNLLDINDYDLSVAIGLKPGTGETVDSALVRIATEESLPVKESTIVGRQEVDMDGLLMSFGVFDSMLQVHIGPNERSHSNRRAAELDNLIFYLIIDVRATGPIANYIGHKVKMQVQMRMTPSNFTINATVNQEAVTAIMEMLQQYVLGSDE